MELNSIKEKKIYSRSFSKIKKINLEKIGFNKIHEPNIFEYQSRAFKILNYEINSKLKFLISSSENNIYIELLSINGMPDLLKKAIVVVIKVNIYQEFNTCKVKRFISITLKKEILFMKLIPDKIIKKLLFKVIEAISERFDKKLFNKLINS